MKRRWLGILLTICMVLTLLPTAAWAEEGTEPVTKEVSTEAELTNALAGTADIIKLANDITITESLTVGRTVTLDLNDKVLTRTGSGRVIGVTSDGALTLTDSAETKTARTIDSKWSVTGGVITGGNIYKEHGGGVYNSGAFTMTGGSIVGCTATSAYSGAKGGGVYNSGAFTMTGGAIVGCTAAGDAHILGPAYGGGIYSVGSLTLSGTAEIRDCHATASGQEGSYAEGGGVWGKTVTIGGEVRITGCTTTDGQSDAMSVSSGAITGGTFEGTVWSGAAISGGTFLAAVTNEGYGAVTGGTFYGGLTGAVSGCTVTYMDGTTEYAKQVVESGKTATAPVAPDAPDTSTFFAGWYTDEGCTTIYPFSQPVTEDKILYAHWTDTIYALITDAAGNGYYVTDRNQADVLGDGTVVYVPGALDQAKIPDEYWDNDHSSFTEAAMEKLRRGEELPGICFPTLTLDGAKLQSILGVSEGTDIGLSDFFLRIELKGENHIDYPGEGEAPALGCYGMILTGDGSLTVDAPDAQAAVAFAFLYRQQSGTVTLHAKVYGMSSSQVARCYFHGGSLTIQAGDAGSEGSGALAGGLSSFLANSSLSENAAIKLGGAPDDSERFDPPDVKDQIQAALEKDTIPASPYYFSLFANHTVTFDTDGGSEVERQTVAYGETATAPEAPTRSGYTFDGWYLGEEAYGFDTPVTADLALTAKWTARPSGGGGTTYVTLTFDPNGGSALSALRLARGSTVDLARYVPERSGHVFTGWYADAALTQPVKSVTLTTGTTVYAGWRAEAPALPFTDVGAGDWFRDDVQYVYDRGLMTGMTADRFAPNEGMTRAMLVTVLWRQAGSPVVNYAMDFSDVAEGAWYAEAVRWAASEGVVGGYGDGRFGPNDPITREQLATILFRHLVGGGAADLAEWLQPYADADQISAYALSAMQWAVGHGVVKGDGEQLDPQGTATRAQVAAMLHRALEL